MARKPGQNRRDALALGLARGLTVRRAAQESGYSTRTAFRLLADAGFRREVSTLRGRLVDRAVGLLAAANAGAVRTLRQLLDDKTAPVRLQAAKCILETGAKLRENLELSERMEALEIRLLDKNHESTKSNHHRGTRSR